MEHLPVARRRQLQPFLKSDWNIFLKDFSEHLLVRCEVSVVLMPSLLTPRNHTKYRPLRPPGEISQREESSLVDVSCVVSVG